LGVRKHHIGPVDRPADKVNQPCWLALRWPCWPWGGDPWGRYFF